MADRGAMFSDDRVYRYSLWRRWDRALPTFVVIGLNPSTADEATDDQTIRRCISFAKREGCGKLVMLNLFALRATDPRVMLAHPAPIGEINDAVIRAHVVRGGIFVAAWGAHGGHRGRDQAVLSLVPSLRCFGRTLAGHPRHPLYLRGDSPLVLFAAHQRNQRKLSSGHRPGSEANLP